MVNFYKVHNIPSCKIREFDYVIEDRYAYGSKSHDFPKGDVIVENNDTIGENDSNAIVYYDTYVEECWFDRVRSLLVK